jgi:hypothetical protein
MYNYLIMAIGYGKNVINNKLPRPRMYSSVALSSPQIPSILLPSSLGHPTTWIGLSVANGGRIFQVPAKTRHKHPHPHKILRMALQLL